MTLWLRLPICPLPPIFPKPTGDVAGSLTVAASPSGRMSMTTFLEQSVTDADRNYTRPGRIFPQSPVAPTDQGSDGKRNNGTVEEHAVRLHAASRRRSDLFGLAVMTDAPMDLMLTALIAHLQGTTVTRTAAAMANRLPLGNADTLIDELILGGLLRRGESRDHIVLALDGERLMTRFVNQNSGVIIPR